MSHRKLVSERVPMRGVSRLGLKPLPLTSVRELRVPTRVDAGLVSLVVVRAVMYAARVCEIDYSFPELSGLDIDAYEDPALAIPQGAYGAMLDALADHAGDENLGLALAGVLGAHHFHLVGPLVMSSVSGEQAVDRFLQLRRSVLGGAAWFVHRTEGEVRIGLPRASRPGARIEAQLGIALAYRLALEFWGERVRSELRVEFAFRAPSDPARFRVTFGEAVAFEASQSSIVLPALLFESQRPEADRHFAASLADFLQARYVYSEGPRSWTQMVRTALASAASFRDSDLTRLAARWRLSARTLRRKLESELTSFREIRDGVCFELAVQKLECGGCSMAQVAEELGYHNLDSFRRAYKRWSRRAVLGQGSPEVVAAELERVPAALGRP